MKKVLLTAVFGSALFLAACGGGDDKADDATKDTDTGSETSSVDVGEGEKIAKQKCISCHGGDLTGGSAPAIDKIGGTLKEDEILDILENGKGGMPKGIVSGQDAENVAAWLATQE